MSAIIPSADRNIIFVEAGIVALRDEKGAFVDPRPLYLAADRKEVAETGLLRSEQEQIEDIASVLAAKFAAYMDGIKAIERHQKSAQKGAI